MTQFSARARRPWRALALLAGILVTGGLVLTALPAQEPAKQDPPKDPPAKVDPPKDTPKTPKIITLPPGTSNDVVECVDLINTKIEEGWKKNKVTPSRPATDYEYIRRATLDIIGRIATPKEIEEYLKWPKDKRRSMLVEALLKHPDYPKHWANLWANWTLTRSGAFGRGEYHEKLAVWLEKQMAENRPYNEIATKLLTASGSNDENPEVNFILAHVGEPVPAAERREFGQFEMVPITSRVTRLFLGIQTQCTQCHDHPFDANLKQNQFWGINAFFRQVTRQGTPPMPNMRQMAYPKLTLSLDSNVNTESVVKFEKRNGVFLETKAVFIDGTALSENVKDRREDLAKFIVAHENFPKSYANRMWGVFFGRGFTSPVDDFNEQNPVSNPELLNELGKKFRHYGFDQKKMIRWICNSEPYNLSCVANKTNDKPEHEAVFGRVLLKAMSPEQLLESLLVATGQENNKDQLKAQRDRWMKSLVDNFGDDEGNEVSFNGTIVQALLMMNGTDINTAIGGKDKGTLKSAMAIANVNQRINYLYLATLNRPVTPKELKTIGDKIALRPQFKDRDAKDPTAPFQDLLWALLNSNEFILNH